MKIGFVVNDVSTELPIYTTAQLARQATTMGHDAHLVGMGDFAYELDGTITALAHSAGGKNYRSTERYLSDVQEARGERVNLCGFDVVLLRSDPADEAQWANNAMIGFGELLAAAGVLVVNAPSSLARALSKAYFQHFPEIVRPRTLISRDKTQIAAFVDELGGRAVLKPLQGSGGSGVFLVDEKESANLSQIIEAITRDGYVVTQEYLPEAKNGDVRLFVMNGRALEVNGRYAAVRRRSSGSDIRSNMSTGGTASEATVTDEMLALVDVVRPKLITDGMFLVGLDVVGDKLMEINVFSPGGLHTAAELTGENFAVAIIESLEHKVAMRRHYPQLTNTELAGS